MSGLLKKRIQVDRNLGTIIGFQEGTIVSYAEIQKGLHKYIRDQNLRIDLPKVGTVTATQTPEPEVTKSEGRGSYCISCGEEIPSGAIFCDLCGVMQ